MMILEGTALSQTIAQSLAHEVAGFTRVPRLAIVRVGDDPRSTVYINRKVAFGKKIGVDVEVRTLPLDVTYDELYTAVHDLSNRLDVDGVIVQSPLPKGLSFMDIVDAIDPIKDVDGLSSKNLRRSLDRARVGRGAPITFRSPATARGVETLLRHYDIALTGKRVLVVGRSLIAGLSSALGALAHDATITVAHSSSQNLPELFKQADIIILAVGIPHFYTQEHAQPHHVVIDVGITATEGGKIVGDADFDAVVNSVHAISPVPGGVGPMTVASLFQNVCESAKERSALLS